MVPLKSACSWRTIVFLADFVSRTLIIIGQFRDWCMFSSFRAFEKMLWEKNVRRGIHPLTIVLLLSLLPFQRTWNLLQSHHMNPPNGGIYYFWKHFCHFMSNQHFQFNPEILRVWLFFDLGMLQDMARHKVRGSTFFCRVEFLPLDCLLGDGEGIK